MNDLLIKQAVDQLYASFHELLIIHRELTQDERLTKRELLAMEFMKTFLMKGRVNRDAVKRSFKYADLIISETKQG